MIQRLSILFLFIASVSVAQIQPEISITDVGEGWANNSVNAIIFRKNSLVTYRDTQFIAYYNQARYMVLGKRKVGQSDWILKQTPFQGNTNDAHNSISIIADGDGYLHVSWDHHGHPLRYAKSLSPGSLDLTEKLAMTGDDESNVTYPEFYVMQDGNLLFLYRSGSSGQGNLVANKYNYRNKTWARLHNNLISGERARNAYWQAFVDHKGTIHVSWVWRESPNVASNHDLGYACSRDGGLTWQKSNGEKYALPITQATAEYAFKIPQNSELINQTSMSADKKGNPFIATYWREANSKIPQYHIVYYGKQGWNVLNLDFRKTAFSLSGGGTKRIPISRPQIMINNKKSRPTGLLLFRDEERGGKASVVKIKNFQKNKWNVFDLTESSLGSWEPTFDTELWNKKRILNLFIQNVQQVDGEGKADIPAQMVRVLQWKPDF
ncbi:BNR repeat-containing protein [Paradesertivirga mongoliensis]|uniref:BNR repeat-containing protein n=1 Tax=Paradesertivirga mongoliensis TaxID=2100740 RepID=A0ABW4ZFK9_9SPHI|nr:BNR repeat-containing protein [Pedobacter mongoliensis]